MSCDSERRSRPLDLATRHARELDMELRRQDLCGQRAEQKQQLDEHRTDAMHEVAVRYGCELLFDLQLVTAKRSVPSDEPYEEGIAIDGVREHAVDDRVERDVADRAHGLCPDAGER